MGKFARFPDIDFSQRDVFETTDEDKNTPPVPERSEESVITTSSEEIQRDRLRPQQSFEYFMGKKYDVSQTDFSDSLVKRPGTSSKGGLRSSRTEYEMLDSQSKQFESPVQKFHRLHSEVTEFLEELNALDQKDVDNSALSTMPQQLLPELRSLQHNLLQVLQDQGKLPFVKPASALHLAVTSQENLTKKIAAQLHAFSSTSGSSTTALQVRKDGSAQQPAGSSSQADSKGCVTYELFYSPDMANYNRNLRHVELEARIARLEKLLGNGDLPGASADVKSALEDLRKRVALLEPGKVDIMARKLQQVSAHLDALLKQRALLGASLPASHAKVGELIEVVERWDTVAQHLPSLVARLQTLQALHQQSSYFAQTLDTVSSEQTLITNRLNTQTSLLNQVQKSFQGNMQAVVSNVEALEKRMADLKDKLAALG